MSNNQSRRVLSASQMASLQILKNNFALSDAELNRVLFFDDRDAGTPWIPPDLLQAIALQVGTLRYVGVKFDQFISQLNQLVWTATVIDERERTFDRSGVATIGERTPNGLEIDTHTLAGGRALQAALTAAGFNPFKAGFVATVTRADDEPSPNALSDDEKREFSLEQTSELRRKDLRQIHKLAANAGLIDGQNQGRYRNWLMENYGVYSSVELSAKARASMINALENYQLKEYVRAIPQDLQNDALIA